jgi:hypothetical protein
MVMQEHKALMSESLFLVIGVAVVVVVVVVVFGVALGRGFSLIISNSSFGNWGIFVSLLGLTHL